MTAASLRRIGRYVLGERLGSGGMGTVFAAVQTGPLGLTRPVAVKELHPHLARDADFVAMLLNEARVQGALEHPNVVPVIDAIAADGELFVVLSVVDGLSLAVVAQRLRERDVRVPASVVSGIACDVLEGLHAAHELRAPDGSRAGVVHRDVSPHNVMLGGDGVARLLDFGIAKAVAHGQTTRDGVVKGKPSYMSPEQLAGEPVDRRSDVFAAAVVVAELLLGRKLSPSADTGEVKRFHAEALVEPATWLQDSGLDASMAEVLGRCLERDPKARPESARAAAMAIDAACPRASAARIAEWIAGELGAELGERRAILARTLVAATSDDRTEPTQPNEVVAGGPSVGRTAHPPAAGVSRATRRDASPPPSRPRATGATLALGALLLASVGFVCGRSSGPTVSRTAHAAEDGARLQAPLQASNTSAPPSQPTPTAPVAAASASAWARTGAPERDQGALAAAPLATSSALAVAPLATSSALAVAPLATSSAIPRRPAPSQASGAAPVAVPVAVPARSAAPPSAAKGASRSCDPPYTIDGAGVRIFKPECL